MDRWKLKVDGDRCVGCGVCVKVCIANNLRIEDKRAKVLGEECLRCGQCTAVCPKRAIKVCGDLEEEQVERTGEVRLNADEVLEVIRFRRSIREFKKREVPEEVVWQILEAGRLTHTAKNMQDVSFVVLDREKERIEGMAVGLFRRIKPLLDLASPMARRVKIDDHFFLFNAPVVIVI